MLKSVMILLLFSISFVHAGEKISCSDLEALSDSLEELAFAFENTETIEAGSEVDKTLAQVIGALYEVADIEQESDLDTNVVNLESARNKMNANAFARALDNVIGSLDRILGQDC